MSEDSAPQPLPKVRPLDWAIAGAVAALYAVVWFLLPGEWIEDHVGGKWFLLLFAPISGAAALFASVFLLTPGLRSREVPAAWLAIQAVFWNPISYRAVLAVADAAGLPGPTAVSIAVVGLAALALPTTLLGGVLSRNAVWGVSYAARAVQCLLVWFPFAPPVLFLHVLMISHLITWKRYGWLNQIAVALVVVEQSAAFTWAVLYYQPK